MATAIAAAMEPVMETRDRQWEQVLARDTRADFRYGVETTGIFCRPDCPSRRPSRTHVRFFTDANAAKAAGFRACLRCCPDGDHPDTVLTARVSAFLREQLDRQVSLAELGRLLGISPFTVQRVFTRATGVSPRTYANTLRAERYRAMLQPEQPSRESMRITDAVYAAGFSGPGRAQHAAPLGMAAKSYRARGRGEQIGYFVASVPRSAASASDPDRDPAGSTLGMILVAATPRGICAVSLGASFDTLLDELQSRFPGAAITEDPQLQSQLHSVLQAIHEPAAARGLTLDLRATAFQSRVWAALAAIPRGETRSYGQVAAKLGSARGGRAVARACAQNPMALLVPCHRVVASGGSLTGYRWGVERKRLLLALERPQTRQG